MINEILLSLFYFFLFCWAIKKWSFFNLKGIPINWVLALFGIKIIAGVCLFLIYTYYYTDPSTADIFKYFKDGKIMFSALQKHPLDYFKMLFGIGNDTPYFSVNYYEKMGYWARFFESEMHNDSHAIIRFNALCNVFSMNFYQVHNIFLNFLSLIGLVGIYKSFSCYIFSKKVLFICVTLIPSVVFWGSGVLKEGLLFFGFGLFLYSSLNLIKGNYKLSVWLLLFGSSLIMFLLKIYVLVAVFPGFFAFFINKKYSQSSTFSIVSFLIINLLVVFVGVNFHYLFPKFNVLEIISIKQNDFLGLVRSVPTNSKIIVPPLQPTLWSFFKAAPRALNNVFIRPFVWEAYSPLVLISGLENQAILLFGGFCFYFRKKWNEINLNLFFFLINYVAILYLLIGLTTPVFGSIVRYKIPGMPLLLVAFLSVLDYKKLKELPFIKKYISL